MLSKRTEEAARAISAYNGYASRSTLRASLSRVYGVPQEKVEEEEECSILLRNPIRVRHYSVSREPRLIARLCRECDSPFRLTNFTLDYLKDNWADEIDFVVCTSSLLS